MNTYALKNESTSIVVGTMGLVASIVAGFACVAPFIGIALGIGGIGWMTRYSFLTVPASIASISLLVAAVYLFINRTTSCANRKKYLLKRNFLIATTFFVVAVNVFEFVILPTL